MDWKTIQHTHKHPRRDYQSTNSSGTSPACTIINDGVSRPRNRCGYGHKRTRQKRARRSVTKYTAKVSSILGWNEKHTHIRTRTPSKQIGQLAREIADGAFTNPLEEGPQKQAQSYGTGSLPPWNGNAHTPSTDMAPRPRHRCWCGHTNPLEEGPQKRVQSYGQGSMSSWNAHHPQIWQLNSIRSSWDSLFHVTSAT